MLRIIVTKNKINFINNDGGRATAGFKGTVGDCVVRAIAIAAERPYMEVYDDLKSLAKEERLTKRQPRRSTVRNGVRKDTIRKYLSSQGWTWVPTMKIGSGCTTHLRADELPSGRLIVAVSRHLVAVINGELHDNHDSSREGTRCVYGYWMREVS